MGTRAAIHFKSSPILDTIEANIYRHWDGDIIPQDMERFFEAVEAQTKDTRYDDPMYLAAKYVVWQAGEYARDPDKPLDFLGIGVQGDDWDYQYIWEVICASRGQRPVVRQRYPAK